MAKAPTEVESASAISMIFSTLDETESALATIAAIARHAYDDSIKHLAAYPGKDAAAVASAASDSCPPHVVALFEIAVRANCVLRTMASMKRSAVAKAGVPKERGDVAALPLTFKKTRTIQKRTPEEEKALRESVNKRARDRRLAMKRKRETASTTPTMPTEEGNKKKAGNSSDECSFGFDSDSDFGSES